MSSSSGSNRSRASSIHDFTDTDWDTRFLGDLYQDLSEAARKKYALLQTPEFVEEFILDRTLDPAIEEFGLDGFRMIDPACGSGHFLLGSFRRFLDRWRKAEPGTNARGVGPAGPGQRSWRGHQSLRRSHRPLSAAAGGPAGVRRSRGLADAPAFRIQSRLR